MIVTFWIVCNQGVWRDEIETNLWGVKDIFDDKGLEFIVHRIKMNLANECSVKCGAVLLLVIKQRQQGCAFWRCSLTDHIWQDAPESMIGPRFMCDESWNDAGRMTSLKDASRRNRKQKLWLERL